MKKLLTVAALATLGLSTAPAFAGTLRLSMFVPDDTALVTIQGQPTSATGIYRRFVLNDERILPNSTYTFHVVVNAGTTKVEGDMRVDSSSLDTTVDYRSAFQGSFVPTCEMGCQVGEVADQPLPLPNELMNVVAPEQGKGLPQPEQGISPKPEQGLPQQGVTPQPEQGVTPQPQQGVAPRPEQGVSPKPEQGVTPPQPQQGATPQPEQGLGQPVQNPAPAPAPAPQKPAKP